MFKSLNKNIFYFCILFGMLLSLEASIFADVGDIGIYREATGTEDEDNMTIHDEAFDTIVHEDTTEFIQDSGDVLVELGAGGHYFVWYSLHFQSTTSSSARTEHIANLNLDGTDVFGSYGQGYSRNNLNEQEIYVVGGSIIEAAAGDDLKVEVQNTSTTNSQAVERRANLNGLVLLKLDDNWNYFRAHLTAVAADWDNGQNTWTGFDWDVEDEKDTIYTHDTGTNPEQITLAEQGHYLVTYSVRFNILASSNRTTMDSRITLDGTPVEHCYSGTYIRGAANGAYDGALAGTCIIETDSDDEVLELEVARSSDLADVVHHVPNQNGITIVKLPDSADYVRVHNTVSTQNVNTTNETIEWAGEDEDDSAFTHSIMTNTGSIQIEEDGNYLFTACTHAEKPADEDSRYPYIEQWLVNSVAQKYGATGAYNRGGHGGGLTQTANDSSNCAAIILDDLNSGDEIEYARTNEGAYTTNAPRYQANQSGITGVYLDSLFMTVGGSTNLSNGTTVALAVNGSLMMAHSDVSGGAYSITVGADLISSGDVVTVFGTLVTDANEATSITKYDGAGNITGMDLDKHVLTVGSNDNQSLTLSDLGMYDNDDTEDVMHVSTNGTLIVDADEVYTDDQIKIKSGNTLTVGGTEAIKVHDVDNNGTLTTAGTLIVEGSWDNAVSAVFTQSSGQIVFAGTMTETITSNGDSFNDVHINDGLVGYWRFDHATNTFIEDFSGYGNDGEWVGTQGSSASISSTINFANSRSADFDGAGDYILARKPHSDQFTISLWVNYDNTSSNANDGIGQAQASGVTPSGSDKTIGMWVQRSNARAWGRIIQSDGTTVNLPVNAGAALSVGIWEHLVYRADGTNYELFLNGNATPVATVAYDGTVRAHDPFFIGTQGGEEWNGQLDDLRIYNRALTTTEIARLAAGNTPQLTLGTYSLQDALDVNGTLSIHGGTLDVNGNDITVNGSWLNTGGVFDDETRTVTLDGGDQAIDYSETFSNLVKSVTTTGTLTIGQQATITIDGALSLSGVSGNLLGIESSTAGTRHTWDVTSADQNTSYLGVKDSETSANDIIAAFSTNVSNNDDVEISPHWIFPTVFYWIDASGGDTNDVANWSASPGACGVGGGVGVPGLTEIATFQANCDNNATVDVNFNVAALDIQSGYTGTITPNSGILIDVDGPYSQADGTIDLDANDTNLNVSGNFTKTGGTFTAGTGTTTLDGALSLSVDGGTDLGNVIVSASPDITVTMASDVTVNDLTIGSGDTLTTDGYELTIDNDFDLNGVLNAVSGADGDTIIDVLGNWNSTAGSFINTDSTVRFSATSGTSDIISDGETFFNLTLDDSAGSLTVEIEDALDVDGTVTITGGTLDTKSGENNAITVAGSWNNDDMFTARLGNITFDGSTEQTIANNAGSFNNVIITNSTGTLVFSEAFTTEDFTDTAAGSILRFQQATTFTINDTLSLTGADGNLIDIDSTSTSQFFFDIQGAGNQTVSHVQAAYSAVSNGSGNDILAANSLNAGNNDDGDASSDQWIFLAGAPDYMQPDVGVPGMNLVVQFIGANFREDSTVTTSSSDIVVGATVVTDASGVVVTTGGRVISASFFILPSASTETVTVTIDGVDVDQKFQIESSATANECEFSVDATIGDGAAGNGTRTKMGSILCDNLIIPAGVTIDVDVTDSDGTTPGNQGYLPVMIIVDGTVDIDGDIHVNGSNGSVNAGDAGGAGGNGGAGGGGGGSGGGEEATQNNGGDGYTGGGGGSCETDRPLCTHGNGGAGTGATGSAGLGGSGGAGGSALITATTGGSAGTGDAGDGSGGSGGTGFAFGTSGSGASDPATNGTGGSGGGAGAFDGNGGGGGFGEAGSNGTGSTGGAVTGNDQLVPFAGGSGGGAGGATSSGGGGAGGGGGALIIYATGTITVDGVVSADGGNGAVGTIGDGGGGSGGAIVLQSLEVQTGSATWNTGGGTGTAAGGDGRIRVDGVPATVNSIEGIISDANTTEFVGPAITSVTSTQVIGTAAASASIDVHLSNGITTSTTTDMADANGDFAVTVTYLSGANYITVVQDTGGSVEVMSPAALGVLSTSISGTSDLVGVTVRCAQNGGLLTVTDTVAGGTFTLSNVSKPDTNDIITCWADGVAESSESTAVTKYDGSGNITGLVLNQRKLTIGSDEELDVTVANLGEYDHDDDEDIMHTSNSSVVVLDPVGSDYTDEELVVLLSNSLTIGAAETLTTHDLDIDGTLTLVGAASVNISGDWDASGDGTWSEGNSVVTFNGAADQIIIPDKENFYDVVLNNTGGSGSDDIVLAGTLDIDNDITITDGDLDPNANDYDIEVFGDWTMGTNGSLDEGTSKVTFNGTGTNQNVIGDDEAFNNVIINNTASAPDNRILVTGTLDVNGTLSVTDGRIDLDQNAGNIEVANHFIIGASGGLLGGNTTETVLFDGVNNQTLTTNGQAFMNIRITNTGAAGTADSVILTDGLDMEGALSITDGDLDVNTNNVNITIAGDWEMGASGTFDAGAGTETVTFDGGDQSILGSTWFNNLIKIETSNNSADTNLTIEAGSTQSIKNTLTLDGLDSNDRINLDSTGVAFFFRVLAAQSVSFLVVQNSETLLNDITATTSTDSGGTDSGAASPHWVFSTARYWVGSTSPANTNLAGSWSATNSACGTGGVGIPTTANDVIFHSNCLNDAAVDALFNVASVTFQPGYTGDVVSNAGIDIDVEGNYIQGDGTLDIATNNTNVTVSGNLTKTSGNFLAGTGNVRMEGSSVITIDSGNLGNLIINPIPNGAVILASDLAVEDITISSGDKLDIDGYELTTGDDVIISGSFDISSGSDGSSTLQIGGVWNVSGGSVEHLTSHVRFTSTGAETITSQSQTFNRLTFDGVGGSWVLQDTLDVDNDLTLANGTLDANAAGPYSITLSADWINTGGSFEPRTGTLTLDSTTVDQNVTSNGGNFYNVVIANTALSGNDDIILVDKLDADGTIRIADGDLDSNTNSVAVDVAGHWIMEGPGSFDVGTSTVTFDSSTADQSITSDGKSFYDVVLINTAPSGSDDIILIDSLDIDGTLQITNGDLDANTNDADINVGANWTMGVLGSFDEGTSTVTFDGQGSTYTITSDAEAFYNLVLNDGGVASTWQLQDDLEVEGTLSISQGSLDVNVANNYSVTVGGDWINSDIFLPRSGTVAFDGTAGQTIETCSGCTTGDFTNIKIVNNSATVAFLDAFSVVDFTGTFASSSLTFEHSQTVTITGDLVLDGQNSGTRISLDSSDSTNRFTFDVTNDQFVDFVSVSNSQSSTSNITANRSNDVVNTDSGAGTPHWIFVNSGILRGSIIVVD